MKVDDQERENATWGKSKLLSHKTKEMFDINQFKYSAYNQFKPQLFLLPLLSVLTKSFDILPIKEKFICVNS